jgi:hypothetical protein
LLLTCSQIIRHPDLDYLRKMVLSRILFCRASAFCTKVCLCFPRCGHQLNASSQKSDKYFVVPLKAKHEGESAAPSSDEPPARASLGKQRVAKDETEDES